MKIGAKKCTSIYSNHSEVPFLFDLHNFLELCTFWKPLSWGLFTLGSVVDVWLLVVFRADLSYSRLAAEGLMPKRVLKSRLKWLRFA
jgi:hypothetical protein